VLQDDVDLHCMMLGARAPPHLVLFGVETPHTHTRPQHSTQARVLQDDVDLHRVTLDAARAEYARLADINGEAVVAWRRGLRQDLVCMAAEVAAVQVRALVQGGRGVGHVKEGGSATGDGSCRCLQNFFFRGSWV